MKHFKPNFLFYILLFALPVHHVWGQKFRFNQYTTQDGISQNFIYSINQDKNGYLWVGTGEGLCKFDGKNFKTYTVKDGLAEDVITATYVDDNGTQWFGHNEGAVTVFKKGKFDQISNEEILFGKINDITGTNGTIFLIGQNEGLFKIEKDELVHLGNFDMESFHSLELLDDQNIILGTSEGIAHLEKVGNTWKKKKVYWSGEWISAIVKSNKKGVLIAGSQGGKLAKIRLKDEKLQFSYWEGDIGLEDAQIQTVLQDKDENIWLGTFGQGLIKLHADTAQQSEVETTFYNSSTGMSSDFVKSVFQDREGNIWIGTFGAGLSRLIDDFFTFYSHETGPVGNNVSAIYIDKNIKWFGVENGLIRIDPTLESKWKFYNSKNKFADDVVTSLAMMDSTLWIGTKTHGIYKFDQKNEVQKVSLGYGSLERRINQIVVDNDNLWIGTEGGLILYNPETDNSNLFGTEDGLAHNAIKTVIKDDNGIVWMGTHSRFIYAIGNASIEEHEITNSGELEVVSITEDQNGDLWIATSESGVFRKTDQAITHYSVDEGLKSNYTYAIAADANNNIWVGHRGALSRISNKSNKIDVFDHNSGIDGQINSNAMFLDENNYLWIGSDQGAIKYDPSKDDKEEVPPVINLLEVQIGEKKYAPDEKIELPYDNYRVQFKFIGISFKNPEKVKYKYKLEGHDNVFSDYRVENTATYGKLSDGEYTFVVTACTEDGTCTTKEAQIDIIIRKPFWKKWWFFLLVVLGIFAGVTVFIRIRLKRLRDNQIYLEEQLAIKTKEVVQKAEVIQQINKDLTASINYAERIQSAMLPQPQELIDKFPNSFIYFKPRDVVSGDFYFIRELNNKLIVACVDCTGHGVPGGFVSMIGSTTLRNIYELMESSGQWKTPDQVLDQLDEEVQTILHQREPNANEDDFFKSRDGMDMTLAEIDLSTNEVKLASAKRYSVLLQNNKTSLLSGDKRPIGGGEFGVVDFSYQSYQMKPGDALFLFSDGYSDQFGGKEGRKLKLTGVKDIIEELPEKNKAEYGFIIKDRFEKWMGDKEQIDDVLMIGIVF